LVDSGRARRSPRQDGNVVVVERPSAHTLDCMFMAAAAMALADGRAEPVEYTGFTRFLRRTELLSRLGRRATAERFASAIDRVVSESADDPVLPQGFRPRANAAGSQLVAQAAVWVAFADGVLHPREQALFNSMLSAFEPEPFPIRSHHSVTSWPVLSQPPRSAPAATDGRFKTGHDGECDSAGSESK
jgi:tellurite resistance protein